jgi:DNA polymerase III sliding clamp (beta) subunit (PCNA family)
VRYYLNGVHFESSAKGIIAAATDGHRLLCVNLPAENAPGIKNLIPRALIEAAVKTKSIYIEITIDAGNVTLASAGQSISGSITDGVFPDYRRVIPESVSGIQGNDFNNIYLVDFDKIGALIEGGKASVLQNGPGNSALVRYENENAVGVIMPLRHDLHKNLNRPAWLELPAPLKAAA